MATSASHHHHDATGVSRWSSTTPNGEAAAGGGGKAESVAGGGNGSGAMTERARGRFGGRILRRVGGGRSYNTAADQTADLALQTEAHINRKLAEMQQKDLATVNDLAARLRAQYDKLRMDVKKRAAKVQRLTDQLSQLDRLSSQTDTDGVKLIDAVQVTQQKLEKANAQYNEALHQRSVYNFMATRLKNQVSDIDKQVKALQSKRTVMREQIKTANLNLHAAKQDAVGAEGVVTKLQKELTQGRQQRSRKMEHFKNTIVSQEAKRRAIEEREAKRVEMARLAQGDLDEEEEDRLKQLFMVRQAYSNMLQKKLEDKRRKSDALEDAFQRIRSATGLDRVDDIVHKFLNRDKTNAELQKQMQDARGSIEELRGTNQRLQSLIDMQRLAGAAVLENRNLYHKVDDYDRRLNDAKHHADEAKQRSFRIMITLEESRACIAKMLNKLAFDPTQYRRRTRTSSRTPSTQQVDLPVATDGSVTVRVADLPKAISLLDERLTTYIGLVAAILDKEADMEPEESEGMHGQAHVGGVRRMSTTTAKEIISTVVQSGPTLLSNLSARHQPGLATADSLAAQRSTMSMLAGKASDRVYRSMMDIEPDTGPSNVRIRASTGPVLESDDEEDDSSDEDEAAIGLVDPAALPSSHGAGGGGGGGGGRGAAVARDTGMVVNRDSLKRLSMMLTEKRSKRKGHHHGSPRKGHKRAGAAASSSKSNHGSP